MARETWTDERLGDLAARVDTGFEEAKVEVRDLRGDMDKGFARVDSDIRELRTDVTGLRSEMNARFDSMQRTLIIGFVTLSASMIGGVFAAVTVA